MARRPADGPPGGRPAGLVGRLLVPHPRSHRDAHQQPLRAEQAADDLAPRFGPGSNEQAEAALLKLACRGFDVVDVELEPCLRDRDVGGPLICPETRLGRLGERPHGERLGSCNVLRVQIVALFDLEGDAQGLLVESSRPAHVGGDRPKPGDEQNPHLAYPRRTARAISRLASRSAIASRLSYCRFPRPNPISTLAWLREKYMRSGINV